jgi:hypothetical protein
MLALGAGPPPDLAKRVAQKEAESEAARSNYLYRQSVIFQEYGERGRPGGEYRETREVIFSPSGERTEQTIGKTSNTLRQLQMTEEDFRDMREIQPMLLTPDQLFLYETALKGEESVDGLDCWVLSVRPRQILYGQRLFEGTFWVDQRDYSIVRVHGRAVPQIHSTRAGKENLFPYFTTLREKVGVHWFPVHTHADDTLHFSSGPIRIRLTIRYRDYKKFEAESTIVPAP